MIVPRRARAILFASVLAIACGDGTGPVAGTLKVTLTTPNSGLDGAAIILLSGPAAPTSVSAGSGLTLWGGPVTTAAAKVIVTGTLSTGTILTLRVDDVNKVGQYHATLQQVAAGSPPYVVRSPLTGYTLSVTK
jgi:hypothetical protein